MFTPTVVESPRPLEPVDRDPFLDGLEPSLQTTWATGDNAADASSFGPELAPIVRAAIRGDEAALRRLVDRFERALRSVTRSYRPSAWEADDVVQTTWLQFLEHGHKLREPAAIAGWLLTTTRRVCLRVLEGSLRRDLTDDPACWYGSDEADPYHQVISAERRGALYEAPAVLPPRSRRLLHPGDHVTCRRGWTRSAGTVHLRRRPRLTQAGYGSRSYTVASRASVSAPSIRPKSRSAMS
jgi:RNA polymerase sigma factor (sigma-70 family)